MLQRDPRELPYALESLINATATANTKHLLPSVRVMKSVTSQGMRSLRRPSGCPCMLPLRAHSRPARHNMQVCTYSRAVCSYVRTHIRAPRPDRAKSDVGRTCWTLRRQTRHQCVLEYSGTGHAPDCLDGEARRRQKRLHKDDWHWHSLSHTHSYTHDSSPHRCDMWRGKHPQHLTQSGNNRTNVCVSHVNMHSMLCSMRPTCHALPARLMGGAPGGSFSR